MENSSQRIQHVGPVPRITEIYPAGNHVLFVAFEDGAWRRYDMTERLRGVFLPLKDEAVFRQVETDGFALIWPGGADIDRATPYLRGEPITEAVAQAKVAQWSH